MATLVEVAPRRGREGSRWYNARPASTEIADWFKGVPLHAGMDHEDYIGGVTLIQSSEKSDEVTGYDNQGLPVIQERKDLVYVPYVKVESRVAYFWRYVSQHPDWEGEIQAVAPVGGDSIGLPPGFFRYAATKPDGKVVTFVGCSMQVAIWERSRTTGERRRIMTPPSGTKVVPASTRWDVDMNALMKAETGAVGRALGMAGMLVVPGSGVATAEDMQEALAGSGAGAAEPTLPITPPVLDDDDLRERAQTLVGELGEADAKALGVFREWAKGRGLTLAEAQGAALRGVVRKLETMLEAARASA